MERKNERSRNFLHIHIVKLIFKCFFLRLEIAKTFHETKIYPVSGDVHCLVYSWDISMMDSEKVQFESFYDVLRNLINMEFQRNISGYTSFKSYRSI